MSAPAALSSPYWRCARRYSSEHPVILPSDGSRFAQGARATPSCAPCGPEPASVRRMHLAAAAWLQVRLSARSYPWVSDGLIAGPPARRQFGSSYSAAPWLRPASRRWPARFRSVAAGARAAAGASDWNLPTSPRPAWSSASCTEGRADFLPGQYAMLIPPGWRHARLFPVQHPQ